MGHATLPPMGERERERLAMAGGIVLTGASIPRALHTHKFHSGRGAPRLRLRPEEDFLDLEKSAMTKQEAMRRYYENHTERLK
jgi:hypothetical protein